MPCRPLAFLLLAATPTAALATSVIPVATAVPGLGFVGVVVTGVVALVIGWWRMRR
jgi:hypothetical protein